MRNILIMLAAVMLTSCTLYGLSSYMEKHPEAAVKFTNSSYFANQFQQVAQNSR